MRRIRSLREFSAVDAAAAIAIAIDVLSHSYCKLFFSYLHSRIVHIIILCFFSFSLQLRTLCCPFYIFDTVHCLMQGHRQFGCILMMCAQKMCYVCVVKRLLSFVIAMRATERNQKDYETKTQTKSSHRIAQHHTKSHYLPFFFLAFLLIKQLALHSTDTATRFDFIKNFLFDEKALSTFMAFAVFFARFHGAYRIRCSTYCLLCLVACLPKDTKTVWYVRSEVSCMCVYEFVMKNDEFRR